MPELKRLLALLTIYLFLNMAFLPSAIAQELPEPELISAETPVMRGETTCAISQLSPEEVQNILNKIRKEGITGESIGSGETGVEDKLLKNKVVLTDDDGEHAAQAEIPDEKVDPRQASWLLNNTIKGAAHFGVVLDDTLRTGRCTAETREKGECYLDYPRTTLRNSGTGIVEDFVTAKDAVMQLFTDENADFGLDEEQKKNAKETIEAQTVGDLNQLEAKVVTRVPSEVIPNIWETQTFKVSMSANCDNPECAISLYSLFDRYFNSAFSSEMVLSFVGPVLWHRAGKAFGYVRERMKGYWPFSLNENKTLQSLDAALRDPTGFLGHKRLANMRARVNRYPQLKKVHDELILGKGGDSGYAMIKGGGFQLWMEKALADDGAIGSIKDPKVREELVRFIGELEGYATTMRNLSNVAAKEYDDAVRIAQKNIPDPDTLARAIGDAKITRSQKLAQLMQNADDQIDLDLPEYFMRKRDFGFPGKGVYNQSSHTYQDLYGDSSIFDKHMFQPFIDDGKWTPENTGYLTDELGNIKLFEVRPEGKLLGSINRDDIGLELAAGKWDKTVVKLRDGTYVPFTPDHQQTILEHSTGPLELYREGWKETDKLTPLRFAEGLTDRYAHGRMFNSAQWNLKRLKQTLVENNFASRRYTSLLDKMYAQEAELMYKYFSSPGAAFKLTALPVFYWHVKRGFGFEDFSFYQLPDEWRTLKAYPREQEIYSDAYVDFFAGNKGSDEGDLFVRVIQYFPWRMILDKVVESFKPAKPAYDKATGTPRRSTVFDLVFYTYGPKECSGCTLTLNAEEDFEAINLAIFSPESSSAFLLEEPIVRQGKESEGSLLVAFAHHTDLVGDSGEAGVEGEPIDLVKAIEDGNTCREQVKKLALGADVGPALGPILAAGENAAYLWFGMPGIFASAAAQLYILTDLKDCVDVDEGYYFHFWSPPSYQEEESQSLQEKGSAKAAEVIKDGKDSFLELAKGSVDSAVTQQLEKVGEEVDNFAKNATRNDLVQANLTSTGPITGKLHAPSMFYLWLQPGFEMSKSRYTTEGKMQLQGTDVNGNAALLELNNETGQLTLNGEKIIAQESSQDHVRLAAVNGGMPAVEIPQTLGHVGLKGTEEEIFEIDIYGHTKALDSAVLDCIKQAVEAQTGLGLNSDDLTEAFGLAEVVVTDSHPQIKMNLIEEKILAEGEPRKVFSGKDTRIFVYGNADVNIVQPNDFLEAGKLESIQFQNGSIVYNKEKQELLVWLKHHEEGKLTGADIKGFKAKLTTVRNPITDCEEYAVDFSVTGDPLSELSMHKTEQFTKSLEHMGPFQVFDTETQTFLFYTELMPDGECINRFRIIDKETGEVYDSAISRVEQTPDGLKVFTEDGRTHDLGFSYENGKPTLTYNGVPSTLNFAQGRNGSFWYDPEKGLWFAENAQLLPLLEAFKNAGLEFKGQGDGTAAATPGSSFMVLDTGGVGPGFLANLPSLPENPLYLLLFIISALGVMLVIQRRERKRVGKKRVRQPCLTA